MDLRGLLLAQQAAMLLASMPQRSPDVVIFDEASDMPNDLDFPFVGKPDWLYPKRRRRTWNGNKNTKSLLERARSARAR